MVDTTKSQVFSPENHEEIFRVSMVVRRDVADFAELASITVALAEIDRIQRTDENGRLLNKRGYVPVGNERSAHLELFRVNSDPVTEFVAMFPWLMGLFTCLSCIKEYKKLKEGGAEIYADIKKLVRTIEGLSEEHVDPICQYLYARVVVILSVETGKGKGSRMFERCQRAGRALIGAAEVLPTIVLTEIKINEN
jgi:hypothetical protein